MPFTLSIREIRSIPHHSGDDEDNRDGLTPRALQWEVELGAGSKSLTFRIDDPFIPSPFPETDPESIVSWYFEKHINEPFETARAESAAERLKEYGWDLAAQITQSGLLPREPSGDLELHIISTLRTEKSPASSGRPLQQLHWEVLEDTTLWPAAFRFNSVSVVRSVTGASNSVTYSSNGRQFRILLVVSRPRPEKDVDYQLVAKCLVAVVDHVSKTNSDLKVSLCILRPPTWQAFREHLRDNVYDLVHFDMKGEIQKLPDGSKVAVVEFCKPDLADPLKMRRDLRTATELGKELALAGIGIVVLNACNSASFRDSAPGSNLAEVLLKHGVPSVLAMAYKVVEEAVEIFMSSFYQSLLAQATSVQDAARVARSALLRNQSRRARYLHNIQLSDYIVPVLYTSPSASTSPGISGTISSYIDKVLTSIKQVAPANWTIKAPTPNAKTKNLLGRDYNILSLEVLLSVSRFIFLHGQGGVGKTAFLRYSCEWWKSSGWIKEAVYIDFDREGEDSLTFYVMEDVIKDIATQLKLPSSQHSVEGVLGKLRSGKYLIVFDSAEAFDTSIYVDRVSCMKEFPEQLKSFIEAATNSESMVIVASRLDTTTIAHVPSDRHKYRLNGLSVLDSVSLLQDLTLSSNQDIPETFYRRENIDALRRASILLEGNPAALELIVPELPKLQYSGEALLDQLMYGVCKMHLEEDLENPKCRFTRTLNFALILPSFFDYDNTLMSTPQLCPFWNIMPKDLSMYYWFLYLEFSKYYLEGTIKNWISPEFKELVDGATMSRKLREHWPTLETKLLNAGILSHATITRKSGGPIPCYHIHPLYTLLSRAFLHVDAWKIARFAYVRQALLWDPGYPDLAPIEWASITWDGQPTPQHDDHLYNWRIIALAWSVQDGNPLEEVPRMGISLLDCTYRLLSGIAWSNPRQARLLVPHLRTHLLQIHMIVDLVRENAIPTASDLHSILDFTWTLWKLESDVLQTSPSSQLALVRSALDTVAWWQEYQSNNSNVPSSEKKMKPHQEVSYHQLRHAEASIHDAMGDLATARSLFNRNLSTDPDTTDPGMRNIIRRWHAQSLNGWAGCVVRLAVRENSVDRERIKVGLKGVREFFEDPLGAVERATLKMGGEGEGAGGGDKGKGVDSGSVKTGKRKGKGAMIRDLPRLLVEHKGMVEQVKVRDQVAFALEKEDPAVVAGWGEMTKEILDGPVFGVFEDIPRNEEGQGETSVIEFFAKVMGEWEKSSRGGDPEAETYVAGLRGFESGIRMLTGDSVGAARAIQAEIARESLSSTTSTGWEKLADLHMYMYMLAVPRAEGGIPDYRKGLTHLNEWWKLHRGVGVPTLERCYGYLKYVTCYHGLGRIADAARSAIKLVETGKTLEPRDCHDGNLSAAKEWLYKEMAKFDRLHIFLDPQVVFSRSPGVAELSLAERVMMHQIMTKAKEAENDAQAVLDNLRRARKRLAEVREMVKGFNIGSDAKMEKLVAKVDQILERPPSDYEEPDFWLF